MFQKSEGGHETGRVATQSVLDGPKINRPNSPGGRTGKLKPGRASPRTRGNVFFSQPDPHHGTPAHETGFLLISDMKRLVFGIPRRRENVVNRVVFRLLSGRIMGSTSLQPDMNQESKELQLEDGLLEQLQDKYCSRVKVSRSSSSSHGSQQTGTRPSERSAPCARDCRRR